MGCFSHLVVAGVFVPRGSLADLEHRFFHPGFGRAFDPAHRRSGRSVSGFGDSFLSDPAFYGIQGAGENALSETVSSFPAFHFAGITRSANLFKP